MNPELIAKAGTEYAHQCALFCWAANNLSRFPELRWFHSIQNEEKSGSVLVGVRSKASGKRKGVSDTCLPVKRDCYSGLYIEMKKPGGKASAEQLDFGKFVKSQGYLFFVCDHWQKAASVIECYLEGKVIKINIDLKSQIK